MARNIRQDRKALKEWILRKLGAPILKVELTEAHLEDAIEDALRWLAAKKGVPNVVEIQLVPGETEYALPADADVVTDVIMTEPTFDLASVFYPTMGLLDGQVPFNLYATAAMGVASDYVQVLQYLETLRRVAGSEAEWTQEGQKLVIAPAQQSGKMIVTYSTSSVPDVSLLGERDYDLVRRYSLANAKETLGRVRSKYGEYPTAQGSTSLDGDRLLEEASTAKEALNEEIGDSGYPLGFLTG